MGKDRGGFYRGDNLKLRRAMSVQKDKRTFMRMHAVHLVCAGKSIRETAFLLSKSRQVVYNWVRMFLQTHDARSLCEAPRSGRPPASRVITSKRILTALKKDPRSVGYAANAWTVKTLADYLGGRYQTSITVDTLRRRMKQAGLRYKRPRYVYEEKPPHAAQKKGPLSES